MAEERGFFSSVEEFVAFSGGDHAIKKILVANNGLGATKAIRSIRRWSYETFGSERAIQFVVMATPEDLKANAEYIRMADEVVDVPGGTNNNNYANITLICEIAVRSQVDAVMPMWGHASENPLLPTSLLSLPHKVSFIGPPAEPMYALGDKIGSTIIAQSAGVPTIAWNGDDLTVDYKNEGMTQAVYDQANVTTGEQALECCKRIGFPVMIKASEGGGGKGIRSVTREEDVLNLFRQVQSEIPGSPIFVMKMASCARHLEVQLLADKYGDAIALSGRDCSVQRRHQKIIEEGPPTAAPKDVFKLMEKAAVSLAKTVGYCNAGTVEYLYMEETQEFAFLELNPRLQVEHPVTENILGLNLPASQLQVAMGIPLCRIMDVRKLYGRHPRGQDTIDFEFAERAVAPRHCIAVRVTAENPEAAFQPTSGQIEELQFRSAVDVWGYFSVDNSSRVHEFADSQFGHIFASGKDRESARRAMVVALRELTIRGDIRTTIEYIIKMIQSDDFVNNHFDTAWLDGRIARHKELALEEGAKFNPPTTLIAAAGASLQAFKHFEQKGEEFIELLRVGQVPSKETLDHFVNIDLIYDNVKYCTKCINCGSSTVIIECNGGSMSVYVRALSDGGYLLNITGKSYLAYMRYESGGAIRMILDGHTCMFTPEYDPTKLASSVAGKFARQLVTDGSHVEAGDAFVEIEVMKMYMPLKVQEAGTVHFQMSEGATLSPGDIIATMQLDFPEKVVKAELFSGNFSPASFDGAESCDAISLPHVAKREAWTKLNNVLDGFYLSDRDIHLTVDKFFAEIDNALVPYYELEEAMSVLRGRIDAGLTTKILDLNADYRKKVRSLESESVDVPFPAGDILDALHRHSMSLPAAQRGAFSAQIGAVWAIAEQYLYSHDVLKLAAIQQVLEKYNDVEKLFDNMSFTDVVTSLRKEMVSDHPKVLSLCRSHLNLPAKNTLLVRLMDDMKALPLPDTTQRPQVPAGVPLKGDINIRNVKLRLRDLSKLRLPSYIHVSNTANLVLMNQNVMKTETRRQRLHEAITSALTAGDRSDRVAVMKKFVDTNVIIRDILLEALRHDCEYQIAVMELYLLKLYQSNLSMNNFKSGHSLDDSNISPWVHFTFTNRAMHNLIPTNISSSDDLSGLEKAVTAVREGVFAVVENMDVLPALFPLVYSKLAEDLGARTGEFHAIHVVILKAALPGGGYNDDDVSKYLSEFLQGHAKALGARGVRRVTFFAGHEDRERRHSFSGGQIHHISGVESSGIFTYRLKSNFAEDRNHRHIEAPHAFHLDLPRLANFSVSLDSFTTSSGNAFLYSATPKVGPPNAPMRYFIRLLTFTPDVHSSDAETLLVEALDHLGIVMGQKEATSKGGPVTGANHIFLHVVAPDAVVPMDFYPSELQRMCQKYESKLQRLKITTVELKISCRPSVDSEPVVIRLVASNPTGYVLKIDKYYETQVAGNTVFKTLAMNGESVTPGPWDGLRTSMPHEISQQFEDKRTSAMLSSQTLYIYDWPVLFERAAELQLDSKAATKASMSASTRMIPAPEVKDVFSCQELVLCDPQTKKPLGKGWTADQIYKGSAVMLPITRPPGMNDVGMVAWLMKIRTLECPTGREVVLISNDITFQAGSFGTREDAVFFKASEFARERGLPRLYLAANSGARIGMAQSLKSKFQISWTDENDPSKGFKYIYLTKADYDAMVAKANGSGSLPVKCTPVDTPSGEKRYAITDIIGEEPDLGVENLAGSGMIAGETARAYNDIFTLTMVVGRTVGIGAYLVRLGQRTIQKTRNCPIILTGYQALNKLMGREIYSTNDQLGGPSIMFPNGVSHLLTDSHLDTVTAALDWLSYIPAYKGAPLPIRSISGSDSIDRTIDFAPPKGLTYDPRLLLAGEGDCKESTWTSGFFDRGSFVEALAGWAKTVVVGRGRLGGIPMGVIVTENRTAEATKPADPADATSSEKMVQQAGGVWFPDSAYKTAQALKDFNREGLPCIIFANWRGFSGGQRDMFDEVLKFGSMIVDALVAYNQPLFVYIPPFAELRGGAWVVVDSTINADVMEFYAAEDARGGVLEAAGAASIKFRDRDIIATAHRIDATLASLDQKLASATDSSEKDALAKQIKQRERMLFGVFQQVAVHFADLHDTPGRMQAKGVIRKCVPWAESRAYFYWRLRRRLIEFSMANKAAVLQGTSKPAYGLRREVSTRLQKFFISQGGSDMQWEDDREFINWTEQNQSAIDSFVAEGEKEASAERVTSCLDSVLKSSAGGSADAIADIFKSSLGKLSAEDRARALEALKLL